MEVGKAIAFGITVTVHLIVDSSAIALVDDFPVRAASPALPWFEEAVSRSMLARRAIRYDRLPRRRKSN
jgi:hypothetical protein